MRNAWRVSYWTCNALNKPEPLFNRLLDRETDNVDCCQVRPPLPPFNHESAIEKVRLAEDGWNSRDPEKVSLAYTLDTKWRNRAEFANNREEAKAFLTRKWAKELDYRLIKELWAYSDTRIAVRYAYEWRDDSATGSVPTAMKTGSSMSTA